MCSSHQYYSDDDIRKSLQYLVDKGYVEKIELEHPFKPFKVIKYYKLTAKGIDVSEGTIKDAGITFIEEEK